jgi:hypothetical protein
VFNDFIPHDQMPFVMKESSGTMHIKPLEGYGFSIIESMASGRPVFLYEPYSLLKSYRNWCIAEKIAIYFNSRDELVRKIDRYFSDSDYRYRLQENAARSVRLLVDYEEQSENLKNHFHYVLDDGQTPPLFTYKTVQTGYAAGYPSNVWKRVEAALDESDLAVLGKIAKPDRRMYRILVPRMPVRHL